MPELGEGDEEQGEELLPVTETDDASLLGQTPQSTDGVLPRPPPSQRSSPAFAYGDPSIHYNRHLINSALCRIYCFVAVVVLAGFLWFDWDDWMKSDIPVWVKVLFILLAVPFGVGMWYWLLCVW